MTETKSISNFNYRAYIIGLLMLTTFGYLLWRFYYTGYTTREVQAVEHAKDPCVQYLEITDTVFYNSVKEVGQVAPSTIIRSIKVPYRCNELILNTKHPNAGAAMDSLNAWGFQKTEGCPCIGGLELWRYQKSEVRLMRDSTGGGGGTVVSDPTKKGGGVGGLNLNFIIDQLPKGVNTAITQNKTVSCTSNGKCPSKPVKIAIVDSGVDTSNVYLQQSCWNPPFKLSPACNNAPILTHLGLDILKSPWGSVEPWDENGHGTHINGIIGGVPPQSGNQMGVPMEILNVKILDANNTCTLFDAMCGLYYALEQGAEVINISWGFRDAVAPSNVFSDFFKEAKSRNVIIVAALGNDQNDIDGKVKFWPACFADTLSNLISVGALNSTGVMADFSNWSSSGRYMSVTADGEQIISSYPVALGGTGLAAMSGTSMATPFVTRTAAVMIGLFKGSGITYTADDIKLLIMNSATAVPAPVHRKLNYGGNYGCTCMGRPCAYCGAVQCPPYITKRH